MKKQLQVEQYWRPGNGMTYNRECLPVDHPEHMYHYIKRVFNVRPEDYGVKHPLMEKYKNVSRSELIERIEGLEKVSYER